MPVVLVFAFLQSFCGCNSRGDRTFVDTLASAIDSGSHSDLDFQKLAPVLVVASVEENRVIHKHVEAVRCPGVFLDLHSIKCLRENVLRGTVGGPEFTFYYFADGRYYDAVPNPLHKKLFQAEVGRRYLFFLTVEKGLLRSVGDVGDYSIEIATGAHSAGSLRNSDLGWSVAELLLRPGDGPDLGLLAHRLFYYRLTADLWGFPLHTVQLLRDLVSLQEPVRSAACSELVLGYHGLDDCLQVIIGDSNETAEMRNQAIGLQAKAANERKGLLQELKDPARLQFPNTLDPDSRRRHRELLQSMLLSKDLLVRREACAALKRYYPHSGASCLSIY
jgi:hypothetical protein